jgi:hypothetical protein
MIRTIAPSLRTFAPLRLACAVASAGLLAIAPCDGAAAPTACSARSGARVPAVVELYTSEGCSSCPPAERWLGGLAARDDVVALAFHVDYWDGLGWKDRFARPQFTQRQDASRRTSGARFDYTPQVIVDGRDTPAWSALAPAALAGRGDARVALALARDGAALRLDVAPAAGAPARIAGFVAVVDSGLSTPVAAGENRGATLREDAVVRELLPWTADGPAHLAFASTTTPEAGATRRWVAVATDPATGRPLQALALACPR